MGNEVFQESETPEHPNTDVVSGKKSEDSPNHHESPIITQDSLPDDSKPSTDNHHSVNASDVSDQTQKPPAARFWFLSKLNPMNLFKG